MKIHPLLISQLRQVGRVPNEHQGWSCHTKEQSDLQTFWEPGVSEGQSAASWLIEIGTHFTTVWRRHWSISEARCWCFFFAEKYQNHFKTV